MAVSTTVLITGANRGIGRGFVSHYLTLPGYTVIAATRNPNNASSQSLMALPRHAGSSLIIAKIDVTVRTDAATAVKDLESRGLVTHLDIVIANAGISQSWPRVSEVDVEEMHRHFVPNVYGVVWLYQATLPLLNKSATPKWVSIGTSAAMLTEMAARPMPNAAYAPGKVAVHWLTAKMHYEEPKLIALPIDPGWVQTDMGNHGAIALGYEEAETTLEDSICGMTKIIDIATKETHSGKLWVFDGRQAPW